MTGNSDYEDKEDWKGLNLDWTRWQLKYFGKYPFGSLFCKVAVLDKIRGLRGTSKRNVFGEYYQINELSIGFKLISHRNIKKDNLNFKRTRRIQ